MTFFQARKALLIFDPFSLLFLTLALYINITAINLTKSQPPLFVDIPFQESTEMLNPQAEQTINDLAGAITHASNQEGKGGVRVTVAKQRHNIAPLNPFALCFAESIGSLIETRKLGAPALGLLFKLLALARNGNLVSVNQRGLALQLGVHPASISRSFKQLIEAGVILEMPEGLFFNPQLVSRWGLEAVSRQYPATVVAGIAALAKQGMSANWVPPPPKAPEEA